MSQRSSVTCITCGRNDVGFVENGECEVCAAARARRQRAAVEVAKKIPARYRTALDDGTLEARVADTKAIAATRAAVDSPALSVVFHGRAGAGKSTLAAWLVQTIAARSSWPEGHRVAWADAHELGSARAAAKLGAEAPIVDGAMHADTLAIDDLGRERGGHFDATADVLWHRHAHEKRTIITTGLELAELRRTDAGGRYDAGFVRRLLEDTHAIVIEVRGRR